MDGGNSAFDSEIWIDANEARSVFTRDNFSSVLARIDTPHDQAGFIRRVETDRRLGLRAETEVNYYKLQTRTAGPIKVLASLLGTAMSIGAIFAAMNTMYASVGARTREIGTLRVL